MKGYSKIKIIHSPSHNSHSRSMEPNPDQWISFEDHTNPNKSVESPPGFQETGGNEGGRKVKNQEISKNQEEGFSKPKLKRNSSVSSGSATFNSAVKKAFSMRRSTSVVDRYCRIHDQASALPSSPTYRASSTDDTDYVSNSTPMKKKSTRGRILKACKKLIGM